ncbi:MAG: DUF1080 domain-containing protein [Pyrinomonadaceae bacterium]|nr:DUF1080 domain-containing protein [Pyrinomonadaceae bacterium]
MQLTRLSLLVFMFVCAIPVCAQEETAFLGKWNITATTPTGSHPYWLEVKKENNALTGYFLNRGGSVFKLPEISIQNNELVWSLPSGSGEQKPMARAKVVGGKLQGTLSTGAATIKWTGVRPPTWGNYDANGKHRFGKPVELFDGKSMANWDIQFKDKPSGWTVVDGTMTNEPHANNLISKQKFKDYKIEVEYKLAEKSNSGIYLRGRYELQVVDDYGKEPESHGHMAIYSRVQPSANASKPANEWQKVEATIVGNRVTVVLNGQKLHDNVVLEGITGGALDSNEAAPGPAMLQGDHGKVWFRKVTVTPILK